MITSGALAKTKIAVEPNIKIQKTGAGGVHYHQGPCPLLILSVMRIRYALNLSLKRSHGEGD